MIKQSIWKKINRISRRIALACFSGILLLGLFGCGEPARETSVKEGNFKIVTSFYPMYVIMMNLVEGVPHVALANMAKPQTGCLHDYQLRPQDLVALEGADLFVANGGDMEEFLDDVLESRQDMAVAYAMDGLSEEELIEGEETDYNPHTWMSAKLYKEEVAYLAQALSQADPANGERYLENEKAYLDRIDEMLAKHEDLSARTFQGGAILLHESFAYLAADYGIPISGSLEVEKDSGFSAGELKEIIEEARAFGAAYIYSDDQYSGRISELLKEELGLRILTLGSGVSGEYDKDSWIDMMDHDLSCLSEE